MSVYHICNVVVSDYDNVVDQPKVRIHILSSFDVIL
jgi:hypothetical protein